MAKSDSSTAVEQVAENLGGEIVEPEEVLPATITAGMPIPDDDALRGIESFDDAVAIATAQWGELTDYAEQYGTGFAVLEDKMALVDKPFLIIAWRVNEGRFGGFSSAIVMTQDGGKWILNDGSSGIYQQLKSISINDGRNGGVLVKEGLRVSVFDTCSACDLPRPASVVECDNVLNNGTLCGDRSEERHEGRTFYLAN